MDANNDENLTIDEYLDFVRNQWLNGLNTDFISIMAPYEKEIKFLSTVFVVFRAPARIRAHDAKC